MKRKGNEDENHIPAALARNLILAGLAFMGNAQADNDPWASVIESTNARLVCGNFWFDTVGEWWRLESAIRHRNGLRPLNLLAKFEGLCREQSD